MSSKRSLAEAGAPWLPAASSSQTSAVYSPGWKGGRIRLIQKVRRQSAYR